MYHITVKVATGHFPLQTTGLATAAALAGVNERAIAAQTGHNCARPRPGFAS